MSRPVFTLALCIILCTGCESMHPQPDTLNLMELQQQVFETERAFAKTMSDRDHQAFISFLSDEAVFFAGAKALRGRQQVADAWKPFYETPDAPFSWEPVTVEVLPSGTLALSSGPVHDAEGKLIAEYTSIWRLEAPGTWRIIFDKGSHCLRGAPCRER